VSDAGPSPGNVRLPARKRFTACPHRGTRQPLVVGDLKSVVPLFGLAAAAFFVAGPAFAQQEGLAEALFREARGAMKRGEPSVACPKFAESYRLDPSVGTLLNLGLCEAELGHTATAWTKLSQFVEQAPAGDDRIPLATHKIAELGPLLAKVRVDLAAGTPRGTITLDDVELGPASLGVLLPVDPGAHRLVVKLPTGESRATVIRVASGEVLEIAPERPAVAPPSAAPKVEQAAPAIPPSRSDAPAWKPQANSGERTGAYVSLGLGVAGVTIGGIFGLFALNDKVVVRDHCPDHVCRDATGSAAVHAGARNEELADVAFVAGAVALTAGSLLLWHSARREVSISAGPGSAALSWTGSFQ